MRRIRSAHSASGVLEIVDSIGREHQLDLSDDSIADRITTSISAARKNPIAVHGHRVQAMFGHVAASLGRCRLIKIDDAGEIFVPEDIDLKVPDYTLTLDTGEHLLVEVKNCHEENPSRPFRLRKRDLDRLQTYAELQSRPLRIAIYWSIWRIWTLLAPGDFELQSTKSAISLVDAMARNKMVDLGDFYLATTPPARLVLLTDPSEPRSVGSNGTTRFTIGEVKMFAGSTEVLDSRERNFLLYMMLYGGWQESEDPKATIEDGELIAVTFELNPVEPPEEQEFAMVGSMSSLIAAQYNDLTTREDVVRSLQPNAEPGALGKRPSGRINEMRLPLWLFHVQPRQDGGRRAEVADFG